MTLSPSDVASTLGAWYRVHARDLPWRRDPSPYRVLLSELMLQQTRVETVLPYFERFLARWPTLVALAAADEADVLAEWAGLGYYARARNLHRCARAAGASLPTTAEALLGLPGVGPYTAGAVASIAFGEGVPLIDGNVERVLSRLDARDADPRSPPGKRALWARARELQDARGGLHPGDLNQALMELGATVCAPRNPSCARCPLQAGCAAAASGAPDAWPKLTKKAPPKFIYGAAAVVRGAEGRLLARRSPGGLLGGLWEPVRVDLAGGEAAEPVLDRTFAAMGLRTRTVRRLGEVTHVFTHRRLSCSVWEREIVTGVPVSADPYDRVAWWEVPYGLSTLARKILALET